MKRASVAWLALALTVASAAGAEPPVLYPQPDGSLGPTRPPTLAQCLKKKGFVFYGASWCPYCAEQERLFGNDAQNLPYVECSADGHRGGKDTAACEKAGIKGYPTWVYPDRSRHSYVHSLDELARMSGCAAPP